MSDTNRIKQLDLFDEWFHIKDKRPYPGTCIQIQHRKGLLDCAVAETTVYNPKYNLILRYNQFEIWGNKKETR